MYENEIRNSTALQQEDHQRTRSQSESWLILRVQQEDRQKTRSWFKLLLNSRVQQEDRQNTSSWFLILTCSPQAGVDRPKTSPSFWSLTWFPGTAGRSPKDSFLRFEVWLGFQVQQEDRQKTRSYIWIAKRLVPTFKFWLVLHTAQTGNFFWCEHHFHCSAAGRSPNEDPNKIHL